MPMFLPPVNGVEVADIAEVGTGSHCYHFMEEKTHQISIGYIHRTPRQKGNEISNVHP